VIGQSTQVLVEEKDPKSALMIQHIFIRGHNKITIACTSSYDFSTLCYGLIMAAGAVESEDKNAMKPSRFARRVHPATSPAMVMAGSQPG
jgi:hypothetical protein